jgi:hypothetical protein
MLKTGHLFLFSLSIIILFGGDGLNAQEGLLDGKVFIGQYRVKHTRSTKKKDEISFINGEFHSDYYSQKGFEDASYIARAEEGKIHFETETASPKQGKIKWRGIVDGDSIEVNYHWSKKGWLSNTEKDYLFQGTLKK